MSIHEPTTTYDALAREPLATPPVEAPRAPRLRVVPAPPKRQSRAPFVILVLGVLSIGLIGLLLVNTSLQNGAFAINDLERKAGNLEERQGLLEQRVATLQAPENLERRARAIGMVPNPNPAFLRLSDGRVLGKAEAAKAPVVARPPVRKAPLKSALAPQGGTLEPGQSGQSQSGQSASGGAAEPGGASR